MDVLPLGRTPMSQQSECLNAIRHLASGRPWTALRFLVRPASVARLRVSRAAGDDALNQLIAGATVRLLESSRKMTTVVSVVSERLGFYPASLLENAFSFFTAFSIAYFYLTGCERGRLRTRNRRGMWTAAVLFCIASIGFFIARMAGYARSVCLMDHVEPTCIAVSWIWGRATTLPRPRRRRAIFVSLWTDDVPRRMGLPECIWPEHPHRQADRRCSCAVRPLLAGLDHEQMDVAMAVLSSA